MGAEMSIEAMKQALDALETNKQKHDVCEDIFYSCPFYSGGACTCGADKANAEIDKAIAAIREALAQSEQEPVAFRNKQTGEFCTGGFLRGQLGKWTPLYDHPYELVCVCGAAWEGDTMVETPSKREWVGLTDEEINDCMSMSIQKTCRAVEAKLREKNGC